MTPNFARVSPLIYEAFYRSRHAGGTAMHTLAAMASATGAIDLDTFPAWLRITHFINFIMMGFLIRSGWEVLASHPRLYWNNHCTPGSE